MMIPQDTSDYNKEISSSTLAGSAERSSLLVSLVILKILEVAETQQTFRLKLRLALQWYDLRYRIYS